MSSPAFPTPYTDPAITFRDLSPVSLNVEPPYPGYQPSLPVNYYDDASTNHVTGPTGNTYPPAASPALSDSNMYAAVASTGRTYLNAP